MKIAAKINDLSLKFYVYSREVLPFLILGLAFYCLMPSTSFAEGVNHLAGLKDDVSKTFGAGSDMQYYLLLAEAVTGAIAYNKTKNVMVLGGVPILMMFTHWALR